MDVNKIKILNSAQTKEITIPLGMNWDLYDREGAIIQEEVNIVQEVIGEPINYELVRFSRRPLNNALTNQVYEFYFYSASTLQWVNSYLTNFTENQVLYYSNPFKKSFFKLDLYDTPDPLTQKIYLTIILSTSQSVPDFSTTETPPCNQYFWFGLGPGTVEYTNCCGDLVILSVGFAQSFEICPQEPSNIVYTVDFGAGPNSINIPVNGEPSGGSPNPLVPPVYFLNPTGSECSCSTSQNLSLNYSTKPKMDLDHIGDQKGYFIHWYQDRDLLGLDELYMRAKFFNGNTGGYTIFTREPQTNYPGDENKLPNELFYYQLHFDYNNFYYWFSNFINDDTIQTLEWYEYLNPNT